VVHRNPKGLSAGAKMFWQSIIALMVAAYLWNTATLPAHTELIIPFMKFLVFPLPAFLFIVLPIWSSSAPATRLIDRRAGRFAIMPTILVSGALAIFAYVAGNAGVLEISRHSLHPGAGELAIFCGAISGAGWAFVVQRLPRRGVYGRCRALSLGAALGVVAVIVRQELVLFFMGRAWSLVERCR